MKQNARVFGSLNIKKNAIGEWGGYIIIGRTVILDEIWSVLI